GRVPRRWTGWARARRVGDRRTGPGHRRVPVRGAAGRAPAAQLRPVPVGGAGRPRPAGGGVVVVGKLISRRGRGSSRTAPAPPRRSAPPRAPAPRRGSRPPAPGTATVAGGCRTPRRP